MAESWQSWQGVTVKVFFLFFNESQDKCRPRPIRFQQGMWFELAWKAGELRQVGQHLDDGVSGCDGAPHLPTNEDIARWLAEINTQTPSLLHNLLLCPQVVVVVVVVADA